MIRGTPIRLGEMEYIAPPLNFAALEKYDEFFRSAAAGGLELQGDTRQMAIVADLVYLSLRRNYPDITPETVKEGLDLGNFQEIFQAIVSTSGFTTRVGEPAPGTGPTGAS